VAFWQRSREYENVDGTVVVNAPPTPLSRDLYHAFLRTTWPRALAAIVVIFLAINVVYGALYWETGGINNAAPGSFFDAFVFSVQTLATIGYGVMAPVTKLANVIVVSEAVVGLLVSAVSTGLVFAKFTLIRPMIAFANKIVIAPMNGVPTLAVRVGNQRGNLIVDVRARVLLTRTEVTAEGKTWYRMLDLPLVREHTPALTRSWNVLHVIDDASPLKGATAESLAKQEVEIIVTLTGTDETSMQTMHARRRYLDREISLDMRYVDLLHVRADGKLVFDCAKFDHVEALPR
jgi:inward rectifier potassium channel